MQHIPHESLADAQRELNARGAWPLHRVVVPACTANRCSSGDRKCPCPEACRIAEINTPTMANTALICAAFAVSHPVTRAVLAIVAVAVALHMAGWLGLLT